MNNANDRRLFWACFIALITTAFAFILRALTADQWGAQFGLNNIEKGEILGAGLWPMALTIILFSLIVDKIGYGRAMVFALICHIVSTVVVLCAPMMLAAANATPAAVIAGKRSGYWMLYWGYFIVALGNGTVEAVINPVVATMFPRDKSKWLNILHAGWPGGLVIGGAASLIFAQLPKDLHITWQWNVALILLPAILYGIMLIGCKFPVNERVAAGVPYRDMLKEFGFFGALIVTTLLVFEVTRIMQAGGFFFSDTAKFSDEYRLYARLIISGIIAGVFGAYAGSLGRMMLVFLLLIMIPLATTELGTDSWIGDIMNQPLTEWISTTFNKPLGEIGSVGGWVLVYTSLIMMILRFFAGPIVHKLSPLGLLACSAAVATIGLLTLSKAQGAWILGAATLYGFGKTFFWPTMLGVVSEQFPKGGALTLSATGGVGMLSVGVIGTVLLGFIQNQYITEDMNRQRPGFLEKITAPRESIFGSYSAIDDNKVLELEEKDRKFVKGIQTSAAQQSLTKVAIFPAVMLVCYLILIGYFKARGGYEAQVLTGHAAVDSNYTGGVEGPVEG